MSSGFARFLGRECQYLDLGGARAAEIAATYRLLIDGLVRAAAEPDPIQPMRRAIGLHQDRLSAMVGHMLDGSGGRAAIARGARPVCGHYSAALQVNILGAARSRRPDPRYRLWRSGQSRGSPRRPAL
jgi:hypothetical protein